MKGPTIPGLVAAAVVLVGYCTMCFWLSPKGEIEHPDTPIVRSAAKSYLGADDVVVLEYEGHGGSGGSGIWWASVRLRGDSQPAPYPPDSLRAFVKRDRPTWDYFDVYMTRGDLVKAHGKVPAWWKADQVVYSARQKRGGGFFACPGDGPDVWNIMSCGR